MQRTLFLLVLFLLSACSKVHDNFLWYRSFGKGEAFFVSAAGDTGLVSGGIIENKPYLVYLNGKHEKVFEYSVDTSGSFTSAIACEEGIVTAGCIEDKLYLGIMDYTGTPVWSSGFSSSFKVGNVILCRTQKDNFLAVASRASDSIPGGNYGIKFISFGKDGSVISNDSIIYYSFYSVNGATIDNSGNIYLAVTKLGAGSKKKATLAKYDEAFRKIWEVELYNNPQFEASSMSVVTDYQGNVYVSGYTEYPEDATTYRNAFVASVNSSGVIRWKKYLEYKNEATSVIFDNNGQLFVLNKGCLILNIIKTDDGSVSGILRTFAACDVSFDKVYGNSATAWGGNSIVIAGVKNGSFYIVARSSEILSPI